MLVWDFFHHDMRVHRFDRFEKCENDDILRVISDLYVARVAATYVFKVRAHAGNPFNEQVDLIAKNMANLCEFGRRNQHLVD